MNWLAWAGLSAAVLSTIAYMPYIIDTVAGRTHPQRAAWLIWSVLGAISFFSQVSEGATASLWFSAVQVSGTIVVFVMSLFVGRGKLVNRSDCWILAAAAFGLFLWYETSSAVYALGIAISISLLGGVATVAKAYRAPQSETISMWVLSFVAAVFASVSVGGFDPLLLAYPVYLMVLNGAIVLAAQIGRTKRLGLPDVAGRVAF